MSKETLSEDLRVETDACIEEIEWFATRKVNLAGTGATSDVPWADVLLSDIADLRKALAVERDTR